MLRLLLLAAATWLASDVGFATFRPEYGAAMIWPLTGVALVWVATGSRRTWLLDTAVFLAANTAAMLLAGATAGQAAMGGLQTVVQAAAYLLVARRVAPGLWSAGGNRPMVRLADLGGFALTVLLASLGATVVRGLGLGLIPPADLTDSALVWVRNFCGMFTIGVVALLVGPLLRSRPAAWRAEARDWWGHWPARSPEAVVVSLVVVGGGLLVFLQDEPLPVSFLLMLPVLWAGLRMSPVLAASLGLVVGMLALVLTLEQRGVFAAVADPLVGALLAQAFVVATLGFAVAIALVCSERLRATAAAQRSEQRAEQRASTLGAVLEQIREGILVVDAHGVVTLRNSSWAHVPGSEARTDMGSALRPPPLYAPDGSLVDPDALPHARALAGEEVVADHLVTYDADGSARTLEVSASPLAPAEVGGPGQALLVVRDVTDVRQREDALAGFAGVVAHDLNNPLTVVHGWADTLADSFAEGDVDAASGRLMTGRIQEAAHHMRRFINDLLAYTVARDQPLRTADVDLSALAEEVASLRRQSERRPEILVQPGLRVHGDPALLRQLLDNLVGNATKYVAPDLRPQVQVTGTVVGDTLELAVVDNGVGVPSRERSRIFDSFVRAHGADFSGTGLGLGICRHVVERHGGRIWVDDPPAEGGSRFVLTLPTGPPAGPLTGP